MRIYSYDWFKSFAEVEFTLRNKLQICMFNITIVLKEKEGKKRNKSTTIETSVRTV